VNIEEVMRLNAVIPVVVINDASRARPIARALLAGGLSAVEVTLRTPAALDVIAEMRGIEGMHVGAGTVLNEKHLISALNAGAEFIVSPGLSNGLSKAAIASGAAYLPGVSNASDIMRGLELGLSHFKFFPAEASGGTPALKALGGPFARARFCPTGGVTPGNALAYLALEQVLCVGGTWLVPDETMGPDEITNRARQAAKLANHA
jgi:2-dehydro-3-deoxyphosphogluconate aldolase/(4S)-4-hydroxy-2-oxoglutarate aldolase